jgi:hypothetical protein
VLVLHRRNVGHSFDEQSAASSPVFVQGSSSTEILESISITSLESVSEVTTVSIWDCARAGTSGKTSHSIAGGRDWYDPSIIASLPEVAATVAVLPIYLHLSIDETPTSAGIKRPAG